MIRESHIEKRVCAIALANGWLVHPKAALGTRGWPDRTFTKGGGLVPEGGDYSVWTRIVFVEFKAPGKKPTPLQIHTHKKLRAKGYEVYVIDSVEAGLELFK